MIQIKRYYYPTISALANEVSSRGRKSDHGGLAAGKVIA